MAALPPNPSPPSGPPRPPGGPGNVVPFPGAKQKPRRHVDLEEEATEDHSDSNWIVSYADMMTLLCVFFVLMYSMSYPDPKRFEELKKDTSSYFGGSYKVPFQDLVERIKEIVKEKGLEKVVTVESDETGVSTIFHGAIFFDSGKAELLPEGSDVLHKLGDAIKKETQGFRIVVEGHTDDNPIVSNVFPSNWELSGARASRVVRLFETMGFDRKHLTAIGYSDTRPILPNRDPQNSPIPQNQSQNRRVVLRVLKGDAVP